MKTHLISAALLAAATAGPAIAQDAFIGQIKPFANTFCPRGYTEANGQTLAISSEQALYSLYGTTFGGDGRSTFALPNLQNRFAVGVGQGQGLSPVTLGQTYGTSSRTLTVAHLPAHSHSFNASSTIAADASPAGATIATFNSAPAYAPAGTSDVVMDSASIGPAGGSQPISIQDPFLALRYCVALDGIYPSRN